MWRQLLWPFGLLFMVIVWLRGKFFDWKVFGVKKLSSPVLSVGNITTGGTGKTPWVQKLSAHFAAKNKAVTILSRGYSGDFDGVVEVDPSMDPRRCGDEPLWLAKNTEAQVFVGRKRFNAGLEAQKKSQVDLFVLDDGFQHRKLHRNLDIVLIDASAPRRHYHPLPVGYLREGFLMLDRANLVVINKCNYATPENLQWVKDKVAKYCPPERIFYSDFVFSHWSPLVEGLNSVDPGEKQSMCCGVGNPLAFLKTLQEQGVKPVKQFIFPDHYYWKPSDVERMTYNMQRESSFDLMITEKDAVKLHRYKKHFLEMNMQMWVCKMKIGLKERESEFFEILEKGLL